VSSIPFSPGTRATKSGFRFQSLAATLFPEEKEQPAATTKDVAAPAANVEALTESDQSTATTGKVFNYHSIAAEWDKERDGSAASVKPGLLRSLEAKRKSLAASMDFRLGLQPTNRSNEDRRRRERMKRFASASDHAGKSAGSEPRGGNGTRNLQDIHRPRRYEPYGC
jgi:hypothetical protein